MYAKDYNTTVYNVIKEVKHHADTQFNDQVTTLRAVIRTIANYCTNLFLYLEHFEFAKSCLWN